MTPQEIKKKNNYIGQRKNKYPNPYQCEYCRHYDSFSDTKKRCLLIGYELPREYSINSGGVCDKWDDYKSGCKFPVIPFLEYKSTYLSEITIKDLFVEIK